MDSNSASNVETLPMIDSRVATVLSTVKVLGFLTLLLTVAVMDVVSSGCGWHAIQ